MCSINHQLKSVYFHIPKCGGLYIAEILERVYDFKTYFFTSEDHYNFVDKNEQHDTIKGFLNIRKKGMYRYFRYSKKFNKMAGMDDEKWETYYKFTFVRNPFDRFISGYKYLEIKDRTLCQIINNSKQLNNYQYFHLMISQYEQLVDNDDKINFNFIGKFENLNYDLATVLNNIGIKELEHDYYLKNNIMINSSSVNEDTINLNKNNYTSKIDFDIDKRVNEEFIDKVANIFNKDFVFFEYSKEYDISANKIFINQKKDIKNKNKNVLEKFKFKQ